MPSTVADLNVIVANTGQVAQRITLTYTLPAGVSDAGTPGCRPVSGSTYRCSPITAAADASRSVHVRLRVAGGAWRNAPLNGSVQATATGSGRGDFGIARDYEGFAVLFPPGPPVAGMGLAATEVRFTALDKPATLQVTLTNRGRASAVAAVEVALPSGVNAAAQADCVPAGARIRCNLGPLSAGRSGHVRMTLSATPDAQRQAPLSGAAFGTLSSGSTVKSTQTSFRILADAATAAQDADENTTTTGVAASSASSAGVTATALALVLAAGALIVLAVVLATTSLLRRREDDPGAPAPAG